MKVIHISHPDRVAKLQISRVNIGLVVDEAPATSRPPTVMQRDMNY